MGAPSDKEIAAGRWANDTGDLIALAREIDRLAEEVSRLRAERDEVLALLESAPVDDDNVCPAPGVDPCVLSKQFDPCWLHRRRALVAKLRGAP